MKLKTCVVSSPLANTCLIHHYYWIRAKLSLVVRVLCTTILDNDMHALVASMNHLFLVGREIRAPFKRTRVAILLLFEVPAYPRMERNAVEIQCLEP